ncbi:MAG TPA: TRAP transporter small permease subunit [Burkholderiaceae bacterium]|nr:TRAP transporter small permease subunit [Burkholderiaceae bacterium]
MQNLIHNIDRVNRWLGHFFGWTVFILTLFVTYEVFSRYAFGNPRPWAFDAMNMLYGTLFMMAGAYALATNAHVRGDVLYGFFPVRLQASLDLLLYFLFYFPGVIALVWAGYVYAGESFAIREHSNITADGPPIYPFKMIIPFAGICLIFQGFAEVVRCIQAIKRGLWPARIEDIEEVDVDNLKTMVTATEVTDDALISASDNHPREAT